MSSLGKRSGEVPSPGSPAKKSKQAPCAFLSSVTVGDVLGQCCGKDIVTIPSATNVLDGFAILQDNGILSAPIRNANGEHTAMFDVLDVVEAVVELLSGSKARNVDDGDANEGVAFAQETLRNLSSGPLADLSKRNLWIPLKTTSTLREAAELLCTEGVHRSPVLDESGVLVGVLSQSALVRYFCDNIGQIAATKLNIPVSEFPKSRRLDHVETVCTNEPALKAFRLMRKKKVSGLGVVDAEGRLVETVSASDLQPYYSWPAAKHGTTHWISDLSSLSKPVSQYLTDRSAAKNECVKKARRSTRRVVSCSPDSSFMEVLMKFALHNVHRVFTVGGDGQPVGVVSLRDVLLAISH